MMTMIMFIMMMTTVISSGGYLTKEPSHDNEEEDFTIMTIVIFISVTTPSKIISCFTFLMLLLDGRKAFIYLVMTVNALQVHL